MAKHEVVARIELFKTILTLLDYNPETMPAKVKPQNRKKQSFNPYQLKEDK